MDHPNIQDGFQEKQVNLHMDHPNGQDVVRY